MSCSLSRDRSASHASAMLNLLLIVEANVTEFPYFRTLIASRSQLWQITLHLKIPWHHYYVTQFVLIGVKL